MNLNDYIKKIRFQLTGNKLELELDDGDLTEAINLAIGELNRYYDPTKLIKVSASSCIDLAKIEEDNNIKINTVVSVYRTHPVNQTTSSSQSRDPMLVSQWNITNSFYGYGSPNWAYNYAAYTTTQQIANTLSTDLQIKEDKFDRKLYITYNGSAPDEITLEYIPVITDPSQVVGFYWEDVLLRLALAHAKIAVARVRTRYTQTNALWTQDGDKLIEEGKTEIKEIRERLMKHANFVYPVD